MKKTIAIVDSRISEKAERKLMLSGFTVVKLPPYSKLSTPVASHTDMLIHRIGKNLISYADYCEEASYVFFDLSLYIVPSGYSMSFADDEVGSEYPNDVGLNALSINGKLFCRSDSLSKMLLDYAKSSSLEIVNTNQGYPACTVLKLTEQSAITADLGMAKALEDAGIRVTLIENGDILLPPYEYGFIGGCGGVYNGKLYLFGDPALHRSCNKILTAAHDEGLEVVSLDTTLLADLGGIIFIECDIK